jgi:hypothetical protein
VKGVVLVLAVSSTLAAVVGIASVAVSGCATTTPAPAASVGRPFDYTPDGGWTNYQPERKPYEADPARAVMGLDRTPSPTSPNPM